MQVLSHVSLNVKSGAFVSLVGPSGSREIDLLRLIVGLDRDYRGGYLRQRPAGHGRRAVAGIVFQDHRLLPWLTLEDNIGLSLENSGQERRRQGRHHRRAYCGLSA